MLIYSLKVIFKFALDKACFSSFMQILIARNLINELQSTFLFIFTFKINRSKMSHEYINILSTL